MAKGLRSKSARRNRSIKRVEIFGPVEAARLAKLAAKQAEIKQDILVSPMEAKQMVIETSVETGDIASAATETAVAAIEDDSNAMKTDPKPETRAQTKGNALKKKKIRHRK